MEMTDSPDPDPHVPQQQHPQKSSKPLQHETTIPSEPSTAFDTDYGEASTNKMGVTTKISVKSAELANGNVPDESGASTSRTIPASRYLFGPIPSDTPMDQRDNPESAQTLTWDAADEKPKESANDGESCWISATKVAKIIYYIILFIIILGSGVLSRVIVHLMIWKLSPPSRSCVGCNTTLGLSTLSGTLELDTSVLIRQCSCNTTICSNGLPSAWIYRPVSTVGNLCTLEEEIPTVNISWIWALFLVMIVPYVYAFLSNLSRVCTKDLPEFRKDVFLIGLIVEIIHTIGLCLLVFYVMPAFDPVVASIFGLSLLLVPSSLNLFFPVKKQKKDKRNIQMGALLNGEVSQRERIKEKDESWRKPMLLIVQAVALVLNLAVIIILCLYIFNNNRSNVSTTIAICVVGSVLVSVCWWENFVRDTGHLLDIVDIPTDPKTFLSSVKSAFTVYQNSSREKETSLIAFLKIICAFITVLVIFGGRGGVDGFLPALQTLLVPYSQGYPETQISSLVGNVLLQSSSSVSYGCTFDTPFIMAILAIISSFIFYKMAQHSCRILCQRIVFAPAILGVIIFSPWLLLLLLEFPRNFTSGTCNVLQPLWNLSNNGSKGNLIYIAIAYILGILSLFLLTFHVWKDSGMKIVKVTKLFTKTLHCGIFTDVTILLSKRRVNIEDIAPNAGPKCTDRERNGHDKDTRDITTTPFIYFCATMWHETENEMCQLLKSIFRTDDDQYRRYLIQQQKQKTNKHYHDPEYYEFEAHVFFDDAFSAPKPGKEGHNVNAFVTTLEECVTKTARACYEDCDIEKPRRYMTPYGARYEWSLLGRLEDDKGIRNKLIVHLKDKNRIRHRKRWSQVMYLYYFLGFKFSKIRRRLDMEPRRSQSDKEKILKTMAENTFILALDGDVDFKPEAIMLLVDRMKKDNLVGAACGRIHPIGSGPMVWYQKFEYAVSHWLQKATEHVSGCVLCSPGCFSLFRGSALMDDNVMKTYTNLPVGASDHIQYDQGEDRWLCTLLLKQGYKVDYSAASDALTYAPEGFYEFYKQRRRWAPSTMANILDLLIDWKIVCDKNQNISLLYIAYQMFLFVSSVLTPGTIFLLILGALMAAFPEIQPWLALLINIIPVCSLCIAIFLFKDETQLFLAAVFSVIYSLVMMVVFIGLVKEGVESGYCSITVVFFCFIAGVFIIAAISHPKEILCILHGFLYFLAVPSMSMLLMIYSLGNLHVVSWGTREVKSEADKSQNQTGEDTTDYHEKSCSIGTLCKCIFCPREQKRQVAPRDVEAGAIKSTVDAHVNAQPAMKVENPKEEETKTQSSDSTDMQNQKASKGKSAAKGGSKPKKGTNGTTTTATAKEAKGIFKLCEPIDDEEKQFWIELIRKYLKPLKQNAKRQKEIQDELLELRNKIFLGFFVINALFVTVVFVLTQVNSYQRTLQITLPCETSGGSSTGSIEPISIAFTLTFGLLLLIQFFGMLYHRFSTFSHILVSTSSSTLEVNKTRKRNKEDPPDTVSPMRKISPADRWKYTKQKLNAVQGFGKGLRSFTENRLVKREGLDSLRLSVKIDVAGTETAETRVMDVLTDESSPQLDPISIKRYNYDKVTPI